MKLNDLSQLLLLHFMILSQQALVAPNSYTKYDVEAIKELKQRAIIRGNYKDVASESAGAIIYNARSISFGGGQMNSSPLRSSIYYLISGGFCFYGHPENLKINLLQTYQINTIKIWLWDRDSGYLRTYDLQVYIFGPGMTSQFLVYESIVGNSLLTIKFADTFVSQIIIFNRNGSSIDQWLIVLKVQAYYAF